MNERFPPHLDGVQDEAPPGLYHAGANLVQGGHRYDKPVPVIIISIIHHYYYSLI